MSNKLFDKDYNNLRVNMEKLIKKFDTVKDLFDTLDAAYEFADDRNFDVFKQAGLYANIIEPYRDNYAEFIACYTEGIDIFGAFLNAYDYSDTNIDGWIAFLAIIKYKIHRLESFIDEYLKAEAEIL